MVTVGFYLVVCALDDFAELGPFSEVFEVEGNAVGFGEVVEVAGVEVEEVRWSHGPECGGHFGGKMQERQYARLMVWMIIWWVLYSHVKVAELRQI